MTTIRILRPGDEELVARFCARYPDTTLFFHSNMLAAGLADHGQRLQGTYAAAIVGDEIVALACHVWLGNVLLEAPVHLESVVREAIAHSGRGVRGFVGRHAQVVEARNTLGLAEAVAKMGSQEDLFSLELSDLRVPAALQSGRLVARHPCAEDLSWLADWAVGYAVEALHEVDGPELRAKLSRDVGDMARWSDRWILEERGRPVSFTAFNARTPDCVQVGGVWTPREERCNGHARAAVAASLLAARAAGVTRSVLFTDTDNHAARACYLGLGFRNVGNYAIVLLAGEHDVAG